MLESCHNTKSIRFQYHLTDLLGVTGLTFFGMQLLIPVMHGSVIGPQYGLPPQYSLRFVFFGGVIVCIVTLAAAWFALREVGLQEQDGWRRALGVAACIGLAWLLVLLAFRIGLEPSLAVLWVSVPGLIWGWVRSKRRGYAGPRRVWCLAGCQAAIWGPLLFLGATVLPNFMYTH